MPCCPVLLSYVNDHTDVLFEQINDDDDDDEYRSFSLFDTLVVVIVNLHHIALKHIFMCI